MYRVKIDGKVFFAKENMLLSDLLNRSLINVEHPCGGMGKCGKCTVTVDGREELSCRYKIVKDITVELPKKKEIQSITGAELSDGMAENMCFVLDIGTTTLAMALVSADDGRIFDVKTCTNPQRSFGADVMTRIDFSAKNGVSSLQKVLVDSVNKLLESFESYNEQKLYVAGNATMLHTFFGINPESMGKAPYTPVFLEKRCEKAEALGIKGISEVIALPSVAAFVGADIVAGLNFVGMPEKGKHNVLIDLGTNAEIVLFSDESALCTAAAAGPCFEGANISCGMSAVPGAVYAFSEDGAKTVDGKPCEGICGTGLVDIIAFLIQKEMVDETGFMEDDEFVISDKVSVTQADVRQYQLAKSAVYSAVLTLMKLKNTGFEDIDKVYISGGFSSGMNIKNAVITGLLPKEFENKCIPVNNSSLLGTVKYVAEKNDLSVYIKNTSYIDLSADSYFADLYVENMLFESD